MISPDAINYRPPVVSPTFDDRGLDRFAWSIFVRFPRGRGSFSRRNQRSRRCGLSLGTRPMIVGYSFSAAREGLVHARVSEFLVSVSLLLVDGRDCGYASWHCFWKNERSFVKSWGAGVRERRNGVCVRLVVSIDIDSECN